MEKVSLPEAAKQMGIDPQFLRVALQKGVFSFGVAVKRKRWAYYINPVKLREYLEGR